MATPIAAFLGRQPLFASMTLPERELVATRMEVVELKKGERLFEEGATGDAWYVVMRGEIVILKAAVDGPDHELGRVVLGESFGEMALLDNSPRLAAAVAESRTTLARLPSTALHALLAEHPRVAGKVILSMARVLCARQRALTAILTDLVDDPETAAPGPHELMAVMLAAGRRYSEA
jgi:CRP-like cAMP-binding protein